MSRYTIYSASRVIGEVGVPGDKSISHRVAMLASLAEGRSSIENYSTSADCGQTLRCLAALGIEQVSGDSRLELRGRGLAGYRAPETGLWVGNSGSTIRMLAGILAGQRFSSVLDGDASIRRRPMRRIVEPLERMGARIGSAEGGYPPLQIEGSALRPIHYDLPVPSAQVKSCVLFAGLFADGRTSITEPSPSRDHSELMLPVFGAQVTRQGEAIAVEGYPSLHPVEYRVPGDTSSASFLIGAALLAPEADLVVRNVLLNPTRTGFIDFLTGLGAPIEKLDASVQSRERVGSIRVSHRGWAGRLPNREWEISGRLVPSLIDEIPILAVLGTIAPEGLLIRDALELRVKESDRISAMAENLRRTGVRIDEYEDGMFVHPSARLSGAEVSAFGDHRVAMSMALAGLRAGEPVILDDPEVVGVSFPGFFECLRSLTR